MDNKAHVVGLIEGVFLLQLGMIVLKWLDILHLSWVWVLSPTWATISLIFVFILLFWKLSKEIISRIITWWRNRKNG